MRDGVLTPELDTVELEPDVEGTPVEEFRDTTGLNGRSSLMAMLPKVGVAINELLLLYFLR